MFLFLVTACDSPPDSAAVEPPTPVPGTIAVTALDMNIYKSTLPLEDGTELAFRATWNAEAPLRFGTRPTFLLARGSLGAGAFLDIQETGTWLRMGAVLVEVLLPGGFNDGQLSTGSFDYRGQNSQWAFGEVLRWMSGDLADVRGHVLTDVVPEAAADLGIVGMSAGVNLAFGALALRPEELSTVKWMVAWEGPYTDQFLDVELMSYEFEVNPTYEPGSCTTTACPFTTQAERIAYDPAGASFTEDPLGATRIDLDGVLYVDEDEDGHYTPGDFYWHMLAAPGPDGELACAPSVDLSEVLDAQSDRLFGDAGRPAWLPPTAWLRDYWATRDASLVLPSLAEARPDLQFIVAASAEDHIYTSVPDHPHVVSLTRYLQELGFAFVRLNPDAVYLAGTLGTDSARLPDNPAGTAPTWPDTPMWLEPEGSRIPFDYFVPPASVLELVDRVQTGDRAVNLDAPIEPVPVLL